MEFGLENTGCQQLISTKIELVRADALIVLWLENDIYKGGNISLAYVSTVKKFTCN
jgi:hypothetical protein